MGNQEKNRKHRPFWGDTCQKKNEPPPHSHLLRLLGFYVTRCVTRQGKVRYRSSSLKICNYSAPAERRQKRSHLHSCSLKFANHERKPSGKACSTRVCFAGTHKTYETSARVWVCIGVCNEVHVNIVRCVTKVCNEGCVTSQRVLLQRSVTRSVTNVRRGAVTGPSKKSLPCGRVSMGASPMLRTQTARCRAWAYERATNVNSQQTVQAVHGRVGNNVAA